MTDAIDTARPGRLLAWASILMMGSVLLSRVMGMVREMVIAWAGGAGGAVDAYKAAFLLPDILNHVLAGGFLSVTFIPIYARHLAERRPEEGDRVVSLVLMVSGGLALLLVAVEWILAPRLVPLVAPGLEGAVLGESVRLTRIVLPAQAFFIPGGVLLAVQMARGRFLLPALAPLVYNAGIIAGGVVLGPRLGMAGFSWGVLAGALGGNLVLQAWGARSCGFRFRPCFRLRHPDLREYVLLTLPLALGLTMTFSTEFFFKFFGSQVSPGAIACLDYALRLMLVLVAAFGQAAGTASYPFLARQAAEGRLDRLNALLDATLVRFGVPVVAGAVLLGVLAPEVVWLVYGRGSFTLDDATATAAALRGFLLGAPAWAAAAIVVRGWFATRNTLVPALVSTAGVLLALPLYAAFTRWWGVVGVALGASVAMWLQAAMIYGLWCWRTSNRGAAGVVGALVRAGGLSVLLGAAAALLRAGLSRWVQPEATFAGALALVLGLSLGFVAATFWLAPAFGLSGIVGLPGRAVRRGASPPVSGE
ncbi:MAG: murein biosynthesis integral membrane protein MurJ [Planctomycetes bacterium]|nr:murein biosynthesis integral membrane protein MurJ [Planctomycetota bacterium]